MILAERPGTLYCIQEDEKQREIRLLLYNYKESDNMKRWIQGHFLGENDKMHGAAMGWTEVEDIRFFRENYEAVEHYLEWTIPMGDDVIISYPEILNIQTELCVYPLDIEEQMKAAVCSGDEEKTIKSLKRFQRYFQNQKVYSPQNIKECYVRFFWIHRTSKKRDGKRQEKPTGEDRWAGSDDPKYLKWRYGAGE